MAQLELKINGRLYSLTCEDEEEPHLQRLGADLDKRLRTLSQQFGAVGEAHLLAIAAIVISDELFDLQARLDSVQNTLNEKERLCADLQEKAVMEKEKARIREDKMAALLDLTASKIEEITNPRKNHLYE